MIQQRDVLIGAALAALGAIAGGVIGYAFTIASAGGRPVFIQLFTTRYVQGPYVAWALMGAAVAVLVWVVIVLLRRKP